MFTSTWGSIKHVFSNKNIVAISITTTLMTIFQMAWQPYWSLWLTEELGATIATVGLLSTIQSAEQLLTQLPGGLIADKFGRRKVIILGSIIRLVPPAIYLIATSWEHALIAVMFNASGNIYMPAFQAIIAESLPSKQRGTGFGVYRAVTNIPRIFMPTIAGIVIDGLGYKDGVHLFNILQLISVSVAIILRSRLITETLEEKTEPKLNDETTSPRSIFSTFRDLPRSIWAMMLIATISGFAIRMVMTLLPIYAVEIIGLSNTEYGLAQTILQLITTLLIMPIGVLSDRIGRKILIGIGEILAPITTFLLILVKDFPQYLALQILTALCSALGGRLRGFAGGAAWQALVADLVPREKLGTVMGLISTVSGTVGTPSSMVGSYIWETQSPEAIFFISPIINAVTIPIVFFFVKEKKE